MTNRKEKIRLMIQASIQLFLRNGGEITYIPPKEKPKYKIKQRSPFKDKKFKPAIVKKRNMFLFGIFVPITEKEKEDDSI